MYRLTFHPENQTFVLRFEGQIDAASGKDAFLRTVSHPSFSAASGMFWDLRGVSEAKVEFADLFAAVQSVVPKLARLTPETRAVILVENDTLFGLARMLEQVVDAMSPLRIRVAQTEDEAGRQLDLPPGRLGAMLAEGLAEGLDALPQAGAGD